MGYPAKFELGVGGKWARICWGCGLFASCEELTYLEGDVLWLCANCHAFCKKYAPFLVKNRIERPKLKTFLKRWRNIKDKI